MATGKAIALLGTPGVGKTTFVIASIHHLEKIDWARIDWKDLPREYGGLVDQLVSGSPLSPTLRLSDYRLQFTNIEYRGSILKMGWFGKVKLEVTDMSGEDYRSRNLPFAECVQDAFAALLLMDPSRSANLAESMAGQIAPLFNAIKYLSGKECDIKYLGLIFTKRYLHKHKLGDIAGFLTQQLLPILSIAERARIQINMFEIDSRGKEGRLDPQGLEQIYYDTLSFVSKVKGARAQLTGTLEDAADDVSEDVLEETVEDDMVLFAAEHTEEVLEESLEETPDDTSEDTMEEKMEFHKTIRLEE